jgi:pimeloyl-ACP methyl ester carboxylesterase
VAADLIPPKPQRLPDAADEGPADGDTVKLHVREWGTGRRVAVLLHGITSDSSGWWRFGPELAERGYRVLAPDLRGHGLSPRGPYGPEEWATDVLESVPPEPELALGHSLGGLVLAVVVERLRPIRAIYEDPAWRIRPDAQAAAAREFTAQKTWSRDQVAAANPRWSGGDLDAKVAALARWDPATAPALLDGRPWDFTPAPVVRSLVLLADPSTLVSPEEADRLRGAGFEVRVVRGAGHSIHRDDYEGFVAGLDGWL